MAFFAGDGPKTGTSPTLERKLCFPLHLLSIEEVLFPVHRLDRQAQKPPENATDGPSCGPEGAL